MDYGPRRSVSTIPALHQVIIPSYRFTCCGNITEWRVGVHPRARGRKHDRIDTLNFQVWRPSPTVKSTGCYSLIGDNSFSVSLTDQVAMVTPSPQHQIQFQPGDVLGFSLENARNDGGVVIDSREQEGNGEEVWYAHIRNVISADVHCPFSMDTQVGRVLNTSTNAAPVISVSYSKLIPALLINTSFNSIWYIICIKYHFLS